MGSHKQKQGFTLIELMIVIAIVAILVSIAYPSYQNHVRKSNRVDAKSLLMQIVLQQERFKTENLTYTTDLTALGYADPAPSENGHYNISALACGGNINICVNLTAAPASTVQMADGNLQLDSNNTKVGKW